MRLGRRLDEKTGYRKHWCDKKCHECLCGACTYRDEVIAHLLMVRAKEKGLTWLQPNRAQREFSKNCTQRNIVLKARQLGITTYVAARFFVATITQPGTLTVQVAHSQESALEIFKIVHRFWENLPEEVREGALLTSHANVRQMVFPRIDSEYRVETADGDAGRGLTIHNLHCSEVARWSRGAEEALASLRAAVPKGGEIVLESTPNGAGGIFYDEWQRAEETGYKRHFFPWWYGGEYSSSVEDCVVRPFTEEEEELARKHGLTEGQILYRRQNVAVMRDLAVQEFAEDAVSCFRASRECVFDIDTVEDAMARAGWPMETSENGRLVTWFPPLEGHAYIVGVDTAGGGSEGDYSCAEVIDRDTGMQCAELHGHFPPLELARKVVALGRQYNHALLAVGRNNHGHAVLAHVRAEGYGNVFRHKNQEGWLTQAANRPAMIENLAAVLVHAPELFHGERFLSECRTFVRHPDGSSGAAVGTHDDCVMAMAVAFAVRREVAGDGVRNEVEVGHLELEV
jgi:hypothetical protein